jgi:hypothetical protein
MGNEIMNIDPMTGEIVRSEVIAIEESRATAETQAGFIVAKRYPRDSHLAMNRILDMCKRRGLAEQAEYAFPKGGKMVTGPSIRLAEAISQQWGNIQHGIRELEETEGATTMMAYCYDLETNVRAERIFTVKHHIKTKKGMKYLDDPRDIYELSFNMGARRLRACILNVIPGDVVELAVEACQATLAAGESDNTAENIAKMVKAFADVGVTPEMIEARIGKNIKALLPVEMVTLRQIFRSISDGMSKPDHWFSEGIMEPQRKTEEKTEETKKTPPKKKAAAKKKAAKPKAEPEADSDPEPPPAPPGDPEPPPQDEGDPGPEEQGSEPTETASLPLGDEEEPIPSNPTMTDKIEKVEFINEATSKQGNPYSLYHVFTAGGTRMSCFDKEVIEKAEEAVETGCLCEIEYRKTDKFTNLIGLEVIG